MRMLFVIPETCPTFRPDVAALFGKYLPRLGVESDVVAGKTPGHVGQVAWAGGRALVCDLPQGQALRHAKTFFHNVKFLFLADRARYDAIQVRDLPITAIFGLAAARLKGLEFFYWMSYPMSEGQIQMARERGISEGLMKFLFPWVRGWVGKVLLYRLVLPGADHVFVQSRLMLEDMVGKGVPRQKMTAVPMGVDLEVARPADIEPSDDVRLAHKRVLVYLGTLDRPRRIELFFHMLAIVLGEVPDTLLVLVGDTEDEAHGQWLRQQAQQSGVSDAVLWTGWLPSREAWRYVRAAEIGLSPIPRGWLLDVSSPTKAIEYLALGVPVVANDQPDQQEVVNESGGGLSVSLTPENFAGAVIFLLRNEAARRDMIAKGRDYVARTRSYQILARDLAETYRTIPGTGNT